MREYAQYRTSIDGKLEGMDALKDVAVDLAGVSATLSTMASSFHAVEPAQLSLLSDATSIMSEALEKIFDALDEE